MRSIAIPRGLVLGLAALAVPTVRADKSQEVQLDIRNARQGKEVQISVRSPEANGATRGQVDAAGTLSVVLEVANLGKAQAVQARVQIAECPDKPDRLTVVGGTEPADTCKDGHTADGCSCQDIGALLLGPGLRRIGVDWEGRMLVQGAAQDEPGAFTGAKPFDLTFRFGAGAELNVLKREECLAVEGFTATCDLDRAGLAPLFLVELLFHPWLGAGLAFEPIAGVSLERDLVSLDTPGLTGTLRNGHFDPKMLKVYLQPTVALTDQLGLYGQVGIGRWWARSGRTFALQYQGQSLVDTTSQEDSGYSAVIGAGLEYQATRRFGARIGWEYAKLKKDEANIDTYLHNLRAMFVVNLSGR